MSDTPRIYVVCLASYNAGTLHGEWIDANQSPEDLQEAVNAMLKTSPESGAEEWAIHDYEGFAGAKIEEYTGLKEISQLAELIEEYGPAYVAYRDHVGEDYATADGFRDAYLGEHSSLEEYAEQFLENTGAFQDVPDMLRNYFDFEKYAHDLEVGGDVFTADAPGGGVFVFDNH